MAQQKKGLQVTEPALFKKIAGKKKGSHVAEVEMEGGAGKEGSDPEDYFILAVLGGNVSKVSCY